MVGETPAVAHSAWTARKAGPRRAVPPGGTRHGGIEPTLGVAGADLAPDGAGAARSEPGFAAAGGSAADALSAAGLAAARRAPPRMDALIDAIATLRLDAPVSAEAALAALPAVRRAGGKPLLIEGLDAARDEWEPLQPGGGAGGGQRYAEFQAAVQMANRTGALNEIEYSEFVQKVQAFAEAVGAMVELPDMLDVVARARELDAFAGQHDAQLAVHLRARGAGWTPGFIQQHASRHGFVAGSVPGRLVLPSPDDGAPPVLALTYDPQAALADEPSRAAVRDVTLSFDVPQTAPAAEPFAAWQAAAQALALGMEADIVDDNGQPLSAGGFAAIGGELGQLYAALEARDAAAGSPVARRLFS